MNSSRKQWGIVAALALPLLLVAGLAFYAKITQSQLVSDYDFVYATCAERTLESRYFSCKNYFHEYFSVYEQVLTWHGTSTTPEYVRFYKYDTHTDQNTELTFSELQNVPLLDEEVSPDDYRVEHRYGGGNFIVGSYDRNYHHYLTKDKVRRPLDLKDDKDTHYANNLHFIGWINNPHHDTK